MPVPKIYTRPGDVFVICSYHFSKVSGLKKNKDSLQDMDASYGKNKTIRNSKITQFISTRCPRALLEKQSCPVAREHKQMVRYAPLLARKGPALHEVPSWRAIMMLPASRPASKNRWHLTFSLNSTLISFDKEPQKQLQVNFQRKLSGFLRYLGFMEGIALECENTQACLLCVVFQGLDLALIQKTFFSKRSVCAPWVKPSFLRQSPFALNPGEGSRTREPQEEEMALSEL